MKKPVALISTDWHIKDDNHEQLIDLTEQKCQLAKELKIDKLICLGDVFNSRKNQSLLTLLTFNKILGIIKKNDLELHCIPGNHDKVSYSSDESFLDTFKHHPNFKLYHKCGGLPFKEHNLYLHFLPFLKEDLWLEKSFKDLTEHLGVFDKNDKHILLSHIAVNGSVNNDGSKVVSSIKTSIFKDYHKVLLGHYHQMSKVGKNIYHLPSIQQNNFGENADKGFTVLYSDGSHELIKSKFKEFVKIKIDIDKLSKKELNNLVSEHSKETSEKNIRFILNGSEEKLKSINRDAILMTGIDVKTVNKEIDVVEDFDEVQITKYTDESVKEEFKNFCEEYGKDYDKGIVYLESL